MAVRSARVAGGRAWILATAAALLGASPLIGPVPASATVVAPPDNGAAAVIARYQARIPDLMAEQGVPGLAIAVVDGDRVLWSQGFGTTARGGGTPVTTDTMFSVQSMSKTFTATAVMQAVGAGLVDLDEPITTYLPEFTVHSAFEDHPERKLTLRMLLAHTGGFTHEAPYGNNYDLDENDFDEHIRSISDTWLRFPVGTGYAYSNLDIDLAGAIVARVRGEPFAAAMEHSLLGPLGMGRSTFDQDEIRSATDRAIGHAAIIDTPPLDVPMAPSGGLYASADDLTAFLRFQLGEGVVDGRTVLDPALMAEMRTVPAPHAGANGGYALGVDRTRWRAQRYVDLFNHGGGGFGFLADLWWLPQLQLGIAVLTNSSDHELQGELALSVLRDLVTEPGSIYRERLLAQPVQADVRDQPRFEPPDEMAALVAAAAMDPLGDEAERWAGYTGEFGVRGWGAMTPTGPTGRFLVADGVPAFESTETGEPVRYPLVEVERGVFLADIGETLDLRGPRPTWSSIDLVPLTGGPSPVSWLVLGAAAVAAVAWLVGGLVGLVRRRRAGVGSPGEGRTARPWRRLAAAVATLVAVLVLATVALIAVLPRLVDTGFMGWLDFPVALRLALHLPFALVIAGGCLVALGGVGWGRGWWSPVRWSRLTAMVAASVALTIQLVAWGLVGWGLG
jgi:CubicO group peptidase (beta-lactamase class C family)